MTTSLDINLLPVSRYYGQAQSERSVLYASEPPRRTARSRGVDRLVLYLIMTGDVIIAPGKQRELLAEIAKKYYATSGSVTSAMKTAAEELNQFLLERNRIAAEKGHQGVGLLCQWVIRDEQFYLAQSGSTQAYWITDQGVQVLYNVDIPAKGLGIVRSAPLNFSQLTYQANNSLILVGKNDRAWNQQTWLNLQGQGPEGVRRKLSNQASADFDILIAQARPGKGKIHLLQPRLASLDESESKLSELRQEAPTLIQSESGEHSVVDTSSPDEDELAGMQGVIGPAGEAAESTESGDLPLQGFTPVQKPAILDGDDSPDFQPVESSQQSQRMRNPAKAAHATRQASAAIGNALKRGLTIFALALGKLFPEELFRTIPSSVMAIMAIIIPLIVVTIASVAYFQLGRTAQYNIYFSQAEQTAMRAASQSELLDQRVNWIAALSLLDQAEDYQVTEQTQTLRLQAQYALDNIDLVKRVNYQPAIEGGLPGGISVSKMVVSAGDLYLLDSKSGKVFRAKPSAQGYQIDSSFQCGPTTASVVSVSSLIDIAAWPAGFEPNASILGVDQGGNIAFCKPGSPMTIIRLALPQSAVGSVKAIDVSRNELFAISQGSRAVWAFSQKTFDQSPRDYFTNDLEKPDNFDTTISFVVDRSDLYLLHNDGKLTYCSTVDIAGVPIRCAEAAFVDMRPGRENLPLITATPLRQMILSSPPDPSLFFLEATDHSIYHFSLRSLIFQRHYMPQRQLSLLPATAFTIYPERRTLFLAIGNEVFHGTIP